MYADLDRPPLRQEVLARALAATPPWRKIEIFPEVGSTNDVLASAARAGEREGLVAVAEMQTGGRGRLDRIWTSPLSAGLTFSMLLRPRVEPSRLPWLSLLVAGSVAEAARERSGLDVRLKWPNDVLVGGRKVGGLLAEVVCDAVVVGVGLNVSTRRDELPVESATSLELEACRPVDRGPLLLAILRTVGRRYLRWVAGASMAADYRRWCDTLGRDVRVLLPDGAELIGEAADVDDDGRLLVRGRDGEVTAVAAADVHHVR